jgi:pimeloyl-ACP methyl ester carboxylesterase
MPTLQVPPDLEIFYRDDCFADAWSSAVPEPILLMHGNSESGEAWNAWMPVLGRQFRVIRPDMRGFGHSSPMPPDYPWTSRRPVEDVLALAEALALPPFHVVAAKIGGAFALRLAAEHPERVRSLTVLGTSVSGQEALDVGAAKWLDHIEKHGVESWARWTMRGRMGSACPDEMMEGWARYMGRTSQATQRGFIPFAPTIDIRDFLPRIRCPTLVVTADGSGLGSVESVKAWQRRIPGSELMVVPGDSDHVAATHAELCVQATTDFIRRRAG